MVSRDEITVAIEIAISITLQNAHAFHFEIGDDLPHRGNCPILGRIRILEDVLQGCEIIAHGYSNSDTLQGLSEPEEAEYLRRVARQIQQFSGQAPAGWSSPWIAETEHTPDLLQEAGYSYVLDFCMDDQPVWLRTRRGQLLAVPYSQEINDSSTIIGRCAGAEEFSRMIIDQFDEMCRAGDELPLVMSVVIHSFISGQPFRLRALRRALEHILAAGKTLWITQPGEIAKHAYSLA